MLRGIKKKYRGVQYYIVDGYNRMFTIECELFSSQIGRPYTSGS